MMHTDGELSSRARRRTGRHPVRVVDMGTTSIEALAAAAPDGRRWFQLYLWRDREASRDFVARAQAAGYEALVLTVGHSVPWPAVARRP
jgi:L-lactate dehydrogenase (cytochrome)